MILFVIPDEMRNPYGYADSVRSENRDSSLHLSQRPGEAPLGMT